MYYWKKEVSVVQCVLQANGSGEKCWRSTLTFRIVKMWQLWKQEVSVNLDIEDEEDMLILTRPLGISGLDVEIGLCNAFEDVMCNLLLRSWWSDSFMTHPSVQFRYSCHVKKYCMLIFPNREAFWTIFFFMGQFFSYFYWDRHNCCYCIQVC